MLYDGVGENESYLLTINEFSILIDSFPAMITNANINRTINSFRDCIRNKAKWYFSTIVTAGGAATDQTFTDKMWDLTALVIGDEAHGDQIVYLRRTTKSYGSSIHAWIERIQHINGLLPNVQINQYILPDN